VPKTIATVIVLVLYLLHQDIWYWRSARPLVFGALPIGLFYHVAFTVATSVALWWLVRLVWPAHLELDSSPTPQSIERGSAPR
jgi:hypothetical protein